ncbi:hypothetical protein BK129_14950 [Paenibacillus amylolyticus]|uniref:hypothetical protein n=1 Tax=Paenibacillus amylolyticus TaxID=1451 RepID=UPI00096DFD2C|nr:hypothetical protein [Paenibacillus amylolyticus]OMF05281.1 hypothetical protein BK129_14950 [Paenibacillus amylolyticus]
MPGIDSYSLDNYGLDGPGLPLDALNSKTGTLTTTNGSKSITAIGFKPMVVLLKIKQTTLSGNFSYRNLTAVCWRGGDSASSAIVTGFNNSGAFYSNSITVSDTVFNDDSITFTVSLSGANEELSYQVFGV